MQSSGAIRNKPYCTEEDCKKCGWNPAVAAERKKQKLVKGKNGLRSLKKVEE